MYDRHENERNAFFERIADEYGHEEVPASRVYEIAAEVIVPQEIGLSPLTPKQYAAYAAPDIVRVLELSPTKGASYHVRWGLSLSYFPHKWNPKLRWHRTLKSSRFDVWETPSDYLGLQRMHWREQERFLVGRLNGETFLRKQLEEMWGLLAPGIREWFGSTMALSGVLRALDAQLARKGASSHHFPRPPLVRAFTLSRIGRNQEARLALKEYLDDSCSDAVDCENLSTALESVAKGRDRD